MDICCYLVNLIVFKVTQELRHLLLHNLLIISSSKAFSCQPAILLYPPCTISLFLHRVTMTTSHIINHYMMRSLVTMVTDTLSHDHGYIQFNDKVDYCSACMTSALNRTTKYFINISAANT